MTAEPRAMNKGPAAIRSPGWLGMSEGTAWLSALRWPHWSKNLIAFAPIFMAARVNDGAAWLGSALAVVALSLAASAVYLVNDVLDREADRLHPVKRERLIASGRIGVRAALLAALLCSSAALLLAAWTGAWVGLIVLLYLASSYAYVSALKRLKFLDAGLLALLFALRLLAGTYAAGLPPSPWLMALALSAFSSLALAKRAGELVLPDQAVRMAGRGYDVRDLPAVRTVGLTAGGVATLVMFTYVASAAYDPAYHLTPQWLWVTPLALLTFLGRMWWLAWVGRLASDPIVISWRDPVLLLAGAALVLSFLASMQVVGAEAGLRSFL